MALAFGVLIVALVVVGSALGREDPERKHDARARADESANTALKSVAKILAALFEHAFPA